MNVLILTPDRVGSTLLQRVLTIYMLRKEFNKPVINLHELTNGLESYYNTTLNQLVLGKPRGTEWGYYQSLSEITDLLKSADHYKTSRLAHYHIVNRNDTIADQIPFYEYLNNNFYIISARRRNLFEHALSWSINAHSKKLNVYSICEKINVYADIYKNKITINKESYIKYLEDYKRYIDWANNYFNVQSIFNYDDSANDLEQYILGLDFMKGTINNSWQDMFGQTFNQWNACHRLIPNLMLTEQNGNNQLLLTDPEQEAKWKVLKGSDWPEFNNVTEQTLENLPTAIKQEIKSHFQNSILKTKVNVSDDIMNFCSLHLTNYKKTYSQINELTNNGFLVSNVPIKLQTLHEKKMIINNFDESIEWYNDWAIDNNYELYTKNDIVKLADQEEKVLIRSIIESTNLPAVK
jgi:hypothetical protein